MVSKNYKATCPSCGGQDFYPSPSPSRKNQLEHFCPVSKGMIYCGDTWPLNLQPAEMQKFLKSEKPEVFNAIMVSEGTPEKMVQIAKDSDVV